MMVVPNVLIPGRFIVLTRRNTLSTEGKLHRDSNVAHGSEYWGADLVGHHVHGLVVDRRDHQDVARWSVVQADEGKDHVVAVHDCPRGASDRCHRLDRGGKMDSRTRRARD